MPPTTPESKNAWAVKCATLTSVARRMPTIVLPRNLGKFSQNDEMRLALAHTGNRCFAEASPYDIVWNIGLRACDQRASSADTWCGFILLGQALEHAREILRRETCASFCNSILPDTSISMYHTINSDSVFEVDPVTHIRLDTAPNPAYAHTASLSAFTDLVPDAYAVEVRFDPH